MDSVQRKNFENRLNHWVARQGFWFQLRHSFGGGSAARLLFQLARMAARVAVLLAIVAIAGVLYLETRGNSRSFHEQLQQRATAGLGAGELSFAGVSREGGKLSIARVAAVGTERSFFHVMEARNIRFNMGMLDAVTPVWDPGTITISRLEAELRAGAGDPDASRAIGDVIFAKDGRFNATSYEVGDVSLRWGTSPSVRGSIEHSSLSMSRDGGVWRMVFEGGRFSQNWLRDLEIVNLTLICSRGGFQVERGEFRKDGGTTVDLAGVGLVSGPEPVVSGVVRVKHYRLDGVLADPLPDFVGGSFSGNFTVSGSSNRADGLEWQGNVEMDEGDSIILRERIPLLRALSVVDGTRHYRRIDLKSGNFQLKLDGAGISLAQVEMGMEDLFLLRGDLRITRPTGENWKQAALAGGDVLGGTEDVGLLQSGQTGTDISLRKVANSGQGPQTGGDDEIFDRIQMDLESRRQQAAASARAASMLRYEGSFVVSLPGDVFDRAPALKALHPADDGRVSLAVPLSGFLFELTETQAEGLYQQGRR